MSGSYSHVPSREHLELKESPRPAGAAAPQQPGQTEDDLLDMVRVQVSQIPCPGPQDLSSIAVAMTSATSLMIQAIST